MAALHQGGSQAIALCIEASSATAKVFRRNLELNEFQDQAINVTAAAGNDDAEPSMITTGAGGADYVEIPFGPSLDTVTIRQVTGTHLINGERDAASTPLIGPNLKSRPKFINCGDVAAG